MSDYSSTNVAQLREMLLATGKFSQEEVDKIKGKSNLVTALLEVNGNSEEHEPEFAGLISEVTPIEAVEINMENPVNIPVYNSAGWPDYVMSQFQEDELTEGYPNIYGLRRVGEALLGDIVQSGPTTLFPPSPNDEGLGRSSCVYAIVFNWGGSGREVEFRAAAGSSIHNTDKQYAKYSECIAETRAEARALRKALKLRCVSSEELPLENPSNDIPASKGEWNPTDKITTTQQICIKQRCKESNIGLDKFLKHNGYNFNSLEDVDKQTAVNMIGLLSAYQTSGKDSKTIPQEILI